MTTHHSDWKKYLTILLGLGAAFHLHAQFFPGGGTQPGGGGQSSGARSRTGSANRNYSGNGVGDATFAIDPESRSMVVVADPDTLRYISQVISNLDRPQPQVLIKVVFVE